LRPPRQHRRGLIPSIAGPEGFTPDVPIPVQLARDEEIAAQTEDGILEEEKMDALKVPPPAYGLWRCSVVSFNLKYFFLQIWSNFVFQRINPNLLHWQRVAGEQDPNAEESRELTQNSPITSSPNLDSIEEARPGQPRPPSYISDDGVSYVVSALPPRPPSEIHPAFRIRLP
jgi:hypothetical protein